MALIRVGGKLLHELGTVGGLKWAHNIDGGCTEASWLLTGLPAQMHAPHMKRGAKVEIFDGLVRVWLGVLTEPGDGTVRECYAAGMLSEAHRFMAFSVTDGVTPTDNVDSAIEQAVVDGWDVTYVDDAPTGLPAEEPQRLDEAILAAATGASKRATVRPDGVLRFETDRTTPDLMLMPGVGTLGRASEDYVTHVVVYYVKSVSGTPPVPDDWGTVTASAEDAAEAHGRSTMYVNLTERGVILDSSAAAFAEGLLNRGAARLSFTSGLTVSSLQLRTLGLQRPSLAHITAGSMVRMLGVRSPDIGGGDVLDVLIAGTEYEEGSGVITLTPQGLAPRNLTDVIASIPTQGPSKIVDRSA